MRLRGTHGYPHNATLRALRKIVGRHTDATALSCRQRFADLLLCLVDISSVLVEYLTIHDRLETLNMQFPHLFEPIRIGSKQSRNRVMRLATLTNTVMNSTVTDHTLAIYRRLARGGTGIIITEGARVHPSNTGGGHNLQTYRPETIPSLTRLAQTIRDEGALSIVQLNHNGRQHHERGFPGSMWAPSAIACPYSGGIPHQMTKAEIKELATAFAAGAKTVKQAGCDGVEFHGAQGHLLQQFASAFSNRRDDEYGGSIENRLRFISEILSMARDQAGPDFIIGYRMGYEEFTPGGITLEESKEALVRLLKLGVLDYLSVTQGNFNTIDTHCPDSHSPPLTYIDLQAQLKALAGNFPIVASTRIQTPEQAEGLLAAGKADIVGLCRALVADPEWPVKAKEGHADDIRRCLYMNQCHGSGGRLSCSINPTVGNELEMPALTKSETPRRVVIVGGGPAGLEAAYVAAQRGHHVVLFDKNSKPGGKLVGAERFISYHEVAYVTDFLARQAIKSGIDMRLDTEADAKAIMAERPDAVIVAAGATVTAPALAGDRSVPVIACESEIPANFPPGDVVVMDEDGYFWASTLTEALAREGRKVTYVTRFTEPLREIPKVSRICVLRSLDELNVDCHANMYVDRSEKGAVVLRHYYNGKREIRIANVGAVLWLGVQTVNDHLVQQLRDLGVKDVRVVGDAYMPRRLKNAIAEGHRAARAIQ